MASPCSLRQHTENGASMASSSKNLPVRLQKRRIVDKVQLNRVTLIVAKTGSGKSSQVPQMLLEEGISPILCTQPRRLAVVAISKVVAKERGCQLGDEVGFHIGHKKVASPKSRIIFETAGVLLEELRCGGAKVLSRYRVVIFDEVHERSVESDLALTCIKQFMLRNGNLRLVLMSATFDCDFYKDYFKDLDRGERVEIIPISGSSVDSSSVPYKCEVSYVEDVAAMLGDDKTACFISELTSSSSDEVIHLDQQMHKMITSLVSHLHEEESDWKKNILIFLPTYKALEEQWSHLKSRGLKLKVFVLHSSIDMDHSLQAMEVSPQMRKVILATNVAESSVTIKGVSYVIDTCLSLEIYWDNERRKQLPRLVWVSKSQADQRKGRTGRTCDGQVFRLVPRQRFYSFMEFEKPAIQLLSLREQVLTISCSESKVINDPKVFFSKSMTPPPETTVQSALVALQHAEALKPSLQRGKLLPTHYGKLLASLPLSLESAMLVVKGGQLGLLRETAVLAALMDSSPFPIVHPFGHDIQYQRFLERFYQRRECSQGESKTFSYISVLLANLQAFEFWQSVMKDKQRLEKLISHAAHLKKKDSTEYVLTEVGEEQRWCTQHCLSLSALQATAEISYNVIEKIHLYRPTFLSEAQGAPTYYMAYDFHHCCEFYPDEENLTDKIILLEDQLPDGESGICSGRQYVSEQQFHYPDQIDLLRNLIGQVLSHFPQEGLVMDNDEDEPLGDEPTLCRYFQRGACTRGTECHFAHDFTAKRSVCKYFMTEHGCRYGELCEFRHPGSSEILPIQESSVVFEGSLPSDRDLLSLWPLSEKGMIFIYGEEDFSFTWNLSQYYPSNCLLATSSNEDECMHLKTETAIKQRVNQLSEAGVEIKWGLELHSLPSDRWENISCVLWTIKRDKPDDESLAKRLLDFFSSLSVILLSGCRADIALILTMYNDQYSRYQVERLARNCFFFLEQSIPFDSMTFGVYPHLETLLMTKHKLHMTFQGAQSYSACARACDIVVPVAVSEWSYGNLLAPTFSLLAWLCRFEFS
ncbi:hypothetical protein GOP47_0021530 [Adiantum capillus-veneris]|uniref:Uncharacterized protein n=1 Tax=Adiantum capillus-veneris TaxID=13818 RepID=A0A9D4U7P3_ADICA|nr:hypothetical protein GOP47_0021530 [Adiantum capillus-veneris]